MSPVPEDLDYHEAMGVLHDWQGRDVLVVAFVDPGVSLRPLRGVLRAESEERVMRATLEGPGSDLVRIAFPAATFHDARWVPGMEGHGLSIEQGATRIDVFLDGPGD